MSNKKSGNQSIILDNHYENPGMIPGEVIGNPGIWTGFPDSSGPDRKKLHTDKIRFTRISRRNLPESGNLEFRKISHGFLDGIPGQP